METHHPGRSDIIHYFHLGNPVRYYMIHPHGRLETGRCCYRPFHITGS